jgi:hypothetical protein
MKEYTIEEIKDLLPKLYEAIDYQDYLLNGLYQKANYIRGNADIAYIDKEGSPQLFSAFFEKSHTVPKSADISAYFYSALCTKHLNVEIQLSIFHTFCMDDDDPIEELQYLKPDISYLLKALDTFEGYYENR